MQDLSGQKKKKREQKPTQLQRYFLALRDSRIPIPTYVMRHKTDRGHNPYFLCTVVFDSFFFEVLFLLPSPHKNSQREKFWNF